MSHGNKYSIVIDEKEFKFYAQKRNLKNGNDMLDELKKVLNILENISFKMDLKDHLISDLVMTKNYIDGYNEIYEKEIPLDKDIGNENIGMTVHIDKRISDDLLVYSYFKKEDKNCFFNDFNSKLELLFNMCI